MTKTAAILGGGVIGGGWAARFLLMGWDVRVFDPSPTAEETLNQMLGRARKALPALYDVALPAEGKLSFHGTISEAVNGAVWIQESAPERLELKQKLYQQVQSVCDPDAIIGSSTSGFMPSELQSCATRPEQIIVAHPFNPVYLLPLIELVGSEKTDAAMLDRAKELLETVGLFPLKVRQEIPAHIADRFLEAVWREALWLIKDGIATTEEIDDAIRMGFGLRWGQMGLFETYRVAGGPAGMKHFISQFGPALEWPWTKLMDVPELTDELIEMIASQSDAQSGHMSIAELETLRDGNLIGMMRSLKARGSAVGKVLADHEKTIEPDVPDLMVPMITLDRQVPTDWVDGNGHMNESRYVQAMSEASDRFLLWIGTTPDYIATQGSWFTVENHVRYLAEVMIGDRITATTQVLEAKGKKLKLFYTIRCNGEVAATVEQLLIHVDMQTRRASEPPAEMADLTRRIAEAHAAFDVPEGAGGTGRK
ncbi:carnitine 3-dehydrogenase [Nioella aestuarii]|uniref:carnitine 3-dehydrogenase n=1 Tax=Nioella aestuarii TaxID=1662864 RepID=UPI003D7FAAA3